MNNHTEVGRPDWHLSYHQRHTVWHQTNIRVISRNPKVWLSFFPVA